MNKELKRIKDLKERNDMLHNQYMCEQSRNYHLNYIIENELKPKIKSYEYEIETLKGDFEGQHELTKKYVKENKELHNKIDKAIEYINIVAIATNKPQYFQKIKDTIWGEELLKILKGDVDEN